MRRTEDTAPRGRGGMISLVPLLLAWIVSSDGRGCCCWGSSSRKGFVEAFAPHHHVARSPTTSTTTFIRTTAGVPPSSSSRRGPDPLLLHDPIRSGTMWNQRRRRTPASSTRLGLQIPKAANVVRDKVNKSLDVVSHVDRFLGSLLFQRDSLSECVVEGFQSLVLLLLRGSLVPFPSLRRLVFDRTKGGGRLNLGVSPRTALAFVAAYLLTGVVAYSFGVERWSIVDALYFSAVCFTTVGYGDLSPTNRASQLFTGLFGVSGIVLLGSAVATLGSNLVQAQVEAVSDATTQSKRRLMKLFDGMPGALLRHRSRPRGPVTNSYLESLASNSDALGKRDDYPQEIQTVTASDQLKRIVPALATVLVGGFITNLLNGGTWTSLDTVYYSLVTASTIGFGDLAPRTRSARLFCVLYLPLAVASVGEAISSLALSRLRQRQRDLYVGQLRQDLKLEHLRVMDADGDGLVTREEYVNFMLLEMGVLSEEDLSALHEQFDSLDVSGSGFLDKEDLKLMAELRGATAKGD